MKLKPANNKTDCVTVSHLGSKESRILHLPYFLRPFSPIPSIRQGSPTTHFYLSHIGLKCGRFIFYLFYQSVWKCEKHFVY